MSAGQRHDDEAAMMPLRLFVVLPEVETAVLAQRLEAFCDVVDVAAVLLPDTTRTDDDAKELQRLVRVAQAHGAAALVRDDAELCRRLAADGVHLRAEEAARVRRLRRMDADNADRGRRDAGDAMIIGACCPMQRHVAMELGEAGADYLGIDQRTEARGENLLAWWAQMFTVPVVAMMPAAPEEMQALWRLGADFAVPLMDAFTDDDRASALAGDYAESLRSVSVLHAERSETR